MRKSVSPEHRKKLEARLEAMCARDGGLSASAGVQDALRNRKLWEPVLPSHFYDNSKCAQAHREELMRECFQTIRIEVELTESTICIPKYVRDQDKAADEQGYIPTLSLMSDETKAKKSLAYELERAIALLNRACNIADAIGLGGEVGKVLKRLKLLNERLGAA